MGAACYAVALSKAGCSVVRREDGGVLLWWRASATEVGVKMTPLDRGGGALGFAYEYAYGGFASVESLSFMERRRPAADVELWGGQPATL